MRLELGDTDSTQALFTDEEINVYLTTHASDVLKTTAALCDVLATRYSRDYDFETDRQRFQRSQRVKHYQERARELRERGVGIGVATMTKIDGYSDDIASRDVTSDSRGRVKRGYTDPDLPV